MQMDESSRAAAAEGKEGWHSEELGAAHEDVMLREDPWRSPILANKGSMRTKHSVIGRFTSRFALLCEAFSHSRVASLCIREALIQEASLML